MTMSNPAPGHGPNQEQVQEIYRRRSVAIYLRSLAIMIEQGGVAAFDLSWNINSGTTKPSGPLIMSAHAIIVPEPDMSDIKIASLTNQSPQATQDTAPSQISVTDLSPEVPKREIAMCQDPKCKHCCAS